MVEVDQEQRERCQSLLTIDDVVNSILVVDDDRTQEVVAVGFYLLPTVLRVIVVKESRGQVVNQFADLFGFPAVLTLVVLDGKLRGIEQLADRLRLAQDFLHGATPPTISASSPSVSDSRPMISA